MGSPPTLAHQPDDQEPTTPTTRAAEAADDLFRPATPGAAITATHPTALTHQQLVRRIEDLDTRGYRVWNQELLENWPTATDVSLETLRERATAAQLSTEGAEQAFDRLNPTFGVPADTRDPLGQQAVRDREPRWRSAPASPSPPRGRTTATRWCGWAGRTTAPPTPSTTPAPTPSG